MTEPDHKTPNSLLTARRQELNLDIKTVADELQLSVATIRALESGDYEGLPVRVFVRGYINSYSRLLGVDPEPILETLESHGEREENKDGQPIVGNTRQLRLIRYFGTFAVAVFVVSLIFWDSFLIPKSYGREVFPNSHPWSPLQSRGKRLPPGQIRQQLNLLRLTCRRLLWHLHFRPQVMTMWKNRGRQASVNRS